MLLFVLGSSSVSIYYTATFAGKFLGLAVTPISAVLLSVFANMEKFNYMSFYKIVLFSMLIGFIGYFFILIISPYFINLLYPNWAAESIILISITSAISIVRIMNNIINPIILKFRNIKWQPVLKGLNFVLSIGLSFALLQLFGIKGFAIGILISSIVIWVLQVLVFIFSEENSEMELE
jgi:O-antigen/teichoic acid export membrane protein